jgi:hypothetical protein
MERKLLRAAESKLAASNGTKESNMKAQQALNGIRNGIEDFHAAESIFGNSSPIITIAAARLADDMADCFGSFRHIKESGNGAGFRVLASFGAMAAELRRLLYENAELKKAAALQDSAERRRVEAVAELQATRDKLDSIAYDVGELPARFVSGDVPAAASLIRALPDIRQAIRDADSVLGDN